MGLGPASPLPGSADALLEGWCADQVKARRREAKALEKAIGWLKSVAGTDLSDQEFLQDMPIGGPGCPVIPETAVAEFAAVAGMATGTARAYLADAWDLEWRFPDTHAAVREGRVEVWRARQVVATSRALPVEGAGFIDQRIAPIVDKVGITRLRRLVMLAEILTDPDAALARARASAEHRSIDIAPSLSADGLMDVFGRLDYADAQDLEAAIQMVAAELGDMGEGGEPEPLTVRRSKALGVIARRQLARTTDTEAAGNPETNPEAEPTVTRVVHTYVHFYPGMPVARVEQGNTLVPIDQVAEWCATAGTKVIIRPVLDLATTLTRDGYTPSETMREQAILINDTCVHPHCTKPARTADIDHIDPYVPPDVGGPPGRKLGQTNSTNLAPLCRFHHRLKTHAAWTYTQLEPGIYLWHSPAGRTYLRTPAGTTALPAHTQDGSAKAA